MIKQVAVIEFMESEIKRLNSLVEITKGENVEDNIKNRLIHDYKRQIEDFDMKKDIRIEGLKEFYDYDYKEGVLNA
jgi:hypothetical protein